ncbi:hypothetical protein APSETT445_009201 [Aspergillus pseudonomiae]
MSAQESRLSSVLQPKTPIYLLLRRPESGSSSLVALTYIPSNAPVRAKTLFASTRATLVRELGSEKFASTVFATEEDEIVGQEAWKERDAEKNGSSKSRSQREELMGEKERELEAVRRAEDEARSGTPGRDIGIGGSFARRNGSIGAPSSMQYKMPVDDEAKNALRSLQPGDLVQLAIDIPRETFVLAGVENGTVPSSVESHISPSSPRYTFYHYPDTDVVIFVYTCPSGSSIKERMLYASSRMYALQLAEDQGLKISKKSRTFKAVESITDSFATADDALVLVVTERALIADPNESRGAHVGIAHGAFAVTLVAQSADGDTRLLAAHNEIGVVARHAYMSRTLASAVVLPEQDNLPPSPDAGLKRRNSVAEADSESKRRRLSSQQEHTGDRSPAERKQSSPDGAERKPERRPGRGGREEERKRGQRLFGALLGTLSQSSNSAAQKRRADIERRQQDKLKLQDEEYDELKKKRREERVAIRKKEQRLYEEESYYKPWQLRSGDEAIIREQVEEAEATVAREVAEFEARYPAHEEEPPKKQDEGAQQEDRDQAPEPEAELKEDKDATRETDTVGAETNHNRDSEAAPHDATAATTNNISINNDHADVHRGADDDGGEVVEDNEDTVIY